MRPGLLFVGNFLSSRHANRGYGEELTARLAARGWPLITCSSEPRKLPRLADMLATAWRRRRDYRVAHVDVFSGPAFAFADLVTRELRALGKPVVLSLRGGNLPKLAARRPALVRALLTRAERVLAPSGYLFKALAPLAANLEVLPNAVAARQLPFRERTRLAPKLVWVRALHEIYNPVMAVEVLARLSARWPETTLTMVGPDKDGTRAQVEARAAALGVASRLRLVGRVAKRDVGLYLDAADVFLNTTNVDNTPISVIEAMASGLCVVSTSVGGLPDLVDDGRDARLVPRGDASAMAEAIAGLLGDPARAAALAAAARRKALSLDWSEVLPRWERLLGELADRA